MKSVKCLKIFPTGDKKNCSIENEIINFEIGVDQPLIQINGSFNLDTIIKNMKLKYGCDHYILNKIPALYPSHSYYSIFYEATNNVKEHVYNDIGTKIINTPNVSCYGTMYVIHFDEFYEFYDTLWSTFVEMVNVGNKKKFKLTDDKRNYGDGLSINKVKSTTNKNKNNECVIL